MIVDVSTRGGPAQVTTMPSKTIVALALLEEASTISVEASKASAIASAESSKLAYESILLLTGGSASDSAKKADSLDGFTPEPAK